VSRSVRCRRCRSEKERRWVLFVLSVVSLAVIPCYSNRMWLRAGEMLRVGESVCGPSEFSPCLASSFSDLIVLNMSAGVCLHLVRLNTALLLSCFFSVTLHLSKAPLFFLLFSQPDLIRRAISPLLSWRLRIREPATILNDSHTEVLSRSSVGVLTRTFEDSASFFFSLLFSTRTQTVFCFVDFSPTVLFTGLVGAVRII
jgi:hypothetical protein